MNDDKLCISPDALIAMIVTEAQDRALAQMSGPEAAGDVQPSDAFLRKMDALVRNTRRKADRKRHLRAAKRLLIALAVGNGDFLLHNAARQGRAGRGCPNTDDVA